MVSKEEKFKQVVDQQKTRILRICRYYAPSREDEKDIYQEILINIWKSLESFKGNSEIGTWIYRVAVNTSLTFTGNRYNRMKLNIDIENINLGNIIDSNDDFIIKEERLNNLQIQLNHLSVIDKAIIGLVLEGLSTKEIADIIGITEPNVRVKIHRIKDELRNKMKGGGYE